MQMYVAQTREIDDADMAVAEILRTLPECVTSRQKDKHAVGLLITHADALSSGVVAAICEILPFDVVGMTCFASCGGGEVDLDLLTLVVLEDANITFSTALTEDLYGDSKDANQYKISIEKAYAQIKKTLKSEKPALTLTYMPFMPEVIGQDMTNYINEITGQAPLFGGLASDHTAHGEHTYIIYNGQYAKNKLALVCMDGPVKASFKFASLRPDNIQNKESIITKSAGNIVYTVNDIPVANHVKSLGIPPEAWGQAGHIVPFLVDYKDGSSLLARELLSFTPEGYAVFGGTMPEGASIYLGLQSPEGIAHSAQEVIAYIQEKSDSLLGALVVSCVGRALLLGANPLIEAEKALNTLDRAFPYMQLYARGEICPTTMPSGELQNRFHNFSFTVCLFEKNS